MENYLSLGSRGNLVTGAIDTISKKVMQIATLDTAYEQLNTGVCKTIDLLNRFYNFASRFDNQENPYQEQIIQIKDSFNHSKLAWLKKERGGKQLSLVKRIKYDYLLRLCLIDELGKLTALIFQLDVYITVSSVAAKRGFCYANALPRDNNKLNITNLYHPTVQNAVGNDLSLNKDNNVIFLTGANMAGKSTLMKSFGIGMHLAHMGFPIPAKDMEFSVKDGLYISINVPNNLDRGYSHFYAEALRVKMVAEQVAAGKDLVVIFDELFKGTNIKDAYDATLNITEAFSENRNCFFIISTHIIEVGETLRERCSNFWFAYLPTVMEQVILSHTYCLTEGIYSERQGMAIIENEGILDIIRSGNNR